MMKKILLKIFTILIIFGCSPQDTINDSDARTIEIKDVVSVYIPEGTVSDPGVINVTTSTDNQVLSDFDKLKDLFQATERLSYFIRITSDTKPVNDAITVTVKVPSDFLSNIPSDHGIALYAQVYQDGGEEIIDVFEQLTASYDGKTRTISSSVPRSVFTDKRTNVSYDANFIIAAIPKRSSANTKAGGVCVGPIGMPLAQLDIEKDVTSPYSPMRILNGEAKPHLGVDLRCSVGTLVYAADDGYVVNIRVETDPETGKVKGYGKYLYIRHTNGASTLYAHLSETIVKIGSRVTKGQAIALSGNTGTSTGPHLHFEYVPYGDIVQSDKRIDPILCMNLFQMKAPTVSTTNASNITTNKATVGGNVTDQGGVKIFEKGVYWGTSSNPVGSGEKIYSTVSGTGAFYFDLSGLTQDTKYYLCAFASNDMGTGYGDVLSFYTDEEESEKPTVTTGSISSITHVSAICGGNVTAAGTSNVTERGICWDTSDYPKTSDYKVVSGSGTGSFTGKLTGLKPDTRYRVRAYATNNEGTTYGEQKLFRTEKEEIKTIVPSNTASAAPIMDSYTTYRVSINVADYTFAAPIAGESYGGNQVRGFYLRFRTEPDWYNNPYHQVFITNVSSNFDPVFGVKVDASYDYLYNFSSPVPYINLTGKGGDESSNTALFGSYIYSLNSDNIMLIRIYHYYGNETPQITFDIRIDGDS